MALHVIRVVARWCGNIVSSNAANSIAVVALWLTPGKRLDQKQLFSAKPIDSMLCVVLNEVIKRMEQLRSDAIRARAVSNDTEVFVPMRRFHGQCVITNLAHYSNVLPKYRY